jgi:hypothetical protein
MIRSIVLSIFLAVPAAALAQLPVQPKPQPKAPAQLQWQEHRPAGAGFRIEFPGKPALSTREVPTKIGQLLVHLATLEISPTIAYLTLHNSYPAGSVGPAEAALDRARDGMIDGGKRKVLQERRLKVSGMPAARLLVEEPGVQLRMQALVVIRGDDMFQAIFVSQIGSENSPDGQRFLSSFALLPR